MATFADGQWNLSGAGQGPDPLVATDATYLPQWTRNDTGATWEADK